MGHMMQAIIGKKDIIKKITDDWITAQSIELPQEYSLLFLTNAFYNDIEELLEDENMEHIKDFEDMLYYTAPVVHFLKHYSFRSQLVYIETDYVGRYGTQTGALFENGSLSAEPVCGENVINHFLSSIGVYRKRVKDEFDSLGLGIYHSMPEYSIIHTCATYTTATQVYKVHFFGMLSRDIYNYKVLHIVVFLSVNKQQCL